MGSERELAESNVSVAAGFGDVKRVICVSDSTTEFIEYSSRAGNRSRV